jgi:hypothetical protein
LVRASQCWRNDMHTTAVITVVTILFTAIHVRCK